MPGVGKTALGLTLAQCLKDQWHDAQIFLDLHGADPKRRPPLSATAAMQEVIHAFRPSTKLPESEDELRPIYLSVLQEEHRKILLLFDNVASAEQVRRLLPPPNCLLLVTSRQHFTLPGLKWKDVDCLTPEQSAALLRKLAPRVEQDAARAAEICGHLPLALEIVAGIVNDKNLFPVAELLDRVSAKEEKLTPVEAAFEVSFELLSETERQNWYLLAVFKDSFDLHAVETVWGIAAVFDREEQQRVTTDATKNNRGNDTREAMQVLVNANLVQWNKTTGRFRLHDLARQFCDGKRRYVMLKAYANATSTAFRPSSL